MSFIPDLSKRWVTPWIAIDWNLRSVRGWLYHAVRDAAFFTVFFGFGYFLGIEALKSVYIVVWGAFLFEVGQGTMLFRRNGEILDGYLDPLDLIVTPYTVVLFAWLYESLIRLDFGLGHFQWESGLISYGLYVVILLPILIINIRRGTPPELLD